MGSMATFSKTQIIYKKFDEGLVSPWHHVQRRSMFRRKDGTLHNVFSTSKNLHAYLIKVKSYKKT